MFGLTFEKLLLIGVIAVFVIGPQRLPEYSARLAGLVKRLRGMADGAKERMREEMGPEFDEVDWKKLDPRQYDPRRIIRDALLDETDSAAPALKPVSRSGPSTVGAAGGAAAVAAAVDEKPLSAGGPGDVLATPFDSEAT
ncbi:Sec-independent protein translocase TatB [Cnuibacter sp. UC19_7]|uniref:Sec-independent protein translocase TatB n=1 Tax=Cnuibacter sp. UC19_7 TaxID=3350166 RepID=UPI00366F44A8